MYDFNPFREIKKLAENSDFMNNLRFVMDPVSAKQGDEGAKVREGMRADILKKRKHHEELVRKGELTQAEFDRLEKMGEFDIKEAKKFEDFEDCIQFYMDAKDYSREDAKRECGHRKEDIAEASEREYDDFDLGPQVEELPGAEEYEAKIENDQHENAIKDKLLAFLNKTPHNPMGKHVHNEIARARIYANPHEQDSSVVKVAGQTFIVPHGHSPHIKVVS
jgi:hypothetical protein